MKRTAWRLAAVAAVLLAATPSQGQPDEAAVREIEEYLARLEKLGFAGSVAISQAGRPIFASGYGLADRERGIRWGPETVSTIGSITKQFTGAAILALAEAGALSVDDPISKYFAAVPEDKQEITLHHLLTHSSGIVNLDGLGDWDPIDRQEFVRTYESSNAGFSLLGAIIEQLTGKSWEEYVRDRLFLPAGMYETGYVLPQWGDGQLAQGYRGSERWGTVLERPLAEDGPYWVLRANGGVHSNALEMLRWGQALLNGEPLSETSMETYWSPHFDEGGGDSFYGYGWVVLDLAGHRVITHNGGNGILFADMAIVPEAELVMVIQTNVVADFRMAERLLEQIGARLVLGRELPSVPDLAATMSPLYYINVSAHLLAALLWLGGMFFLAIVGAPVLRQVQPATLRRDLFSRLGEQFRLVGWVAIGVVLLTGLGNLYFRGIFAAGLLGSSVFWASSYGKALAVKLAAVLFMLVVQAFHDFDHGPRSGRLDPAAEEGRRARRTKAWLVLLNAIAGLVVVLAGVRLARGG
jgi:CubicO group peptidase (beta-lactamase class C family)